MGLSSGKANGAGVEITQPGAAKLWNSGIHHRFGPTQSLRQLETLGLQFQRSVPSVAGR